MSEKKVTATVDPPGGTRMGLDKLWQWEKRKLACRIRPETGNPAGDDLRERFAELAGADLKEILSEMKQTKKKKEEKDKVSQDHDGDKKFKEVLNRFHILGASQQALTEMAEVDAVKFASATQKNVKKVYAILPKSPPKRVLLEIQRERSKPLRLPDQDENKAATAKLEKKLAKQRAARMKAIALQSSENNKAKKNQVSTEEIMDMIGSVLPSYGGDLYSTNGEYLQGMLYLSRMSKKKKTFLRDGTMRDAKDDGSPLKKTATEDGEFHTGFSEGSSVAESVSAKLYCAAALCNWSRHGANAQRLCSEGAVRAIMQLFLEPSNRIIRFCAGAFRFMSEHTILATNMIEEGALGTIADVIHSTIDEFILGNLGVALLNLTRVNGKEDKVVEGGIVLSLMDLSTIFPDLASTCARALYNLTCIDASYPLIERVIRALMSMPTNGSSNVKHICAAALCNLSDLKQVCVRLVEEGVINVLGILARGSETRTMRVCAVILQNLTNCKPCRADMVSRNCVSVIHGLSSDQDPIILRCIALALSHLTLDPNNGPRIIADGGITALCNIAIKYPNIAGISQPVTEAFQLLANCKVDNLKEIRIKIVEESGITALANLLRLSNDILTLERALATLCYLLIEHENHLPIVQQGLIVIIINLANYDHHIIKDLCAMAFLNLAHSEETRKHLVNGGAVSSLISLSSHKSISTQARCAAALCFVCTYEPGMSRMVSDGVIPALVQLVVTDDVETLRFACAALCRLSVNAENALLISNSGAIPPLVGRVISSDDVTKQYCGAVLSSVSYYESCRQKLSDMNVAAAMIKLASLNDDIIKQRCLVSFANLSCEPSTHNDMVNQGVVGIISDLANTYKEYNYICSAKALCNLACSESTRVLVAKQGAVNALMMIALVHSVDVETKYYCVLALSNLLDHTTVDYMLNESIVLSIANLSRLSDRRITQLCAGILNRLTHFPDARLNMIEKTQVLNSLFALCDTNDEETVILCVRTTANLVLDPQTRSKVIEAGGLRVLEKGASLKQEDASLQCIQAIFSAACSHPSFLVSMSKLNIPIVLLNVCNSSSSSLKYDYACKILALIGWNAESRIFIQTKIFFDELVSLIGNNLQVTNLRWLAQALRFVTIGYGDTYELINCGIIQVITIIFNTMTSPYGQSKLSREDQLDIAYSLVDAIRTICDTQNCIDAVASEFTMNLLAHCVDICADFKSSPLVKDIMYNTAVTCYYFSSNSQNSRANTSIASSITMFATIACHKSCTELTAAALCNYLLDTKYRTPFLTANVANIVLGIIDLDSSHDVLYNCISCIFAMAKVASCRDWLTVQCGADAYVLRISQIEAVKLKANCARTLKNLTTENNDALEEGAVSTLIAMSLEGKSKNQKVSEDLIVPYIQPNPNSKTVTIPSCSAETVTNATWILTYTVTKGGSAGEGPEAPQPPPLKLVMDSVLNISEDGDISEIEARTKMAFAKMQCPNDLRQAYLLTDQDFAVKNNDDESSEVEDEFKDSSMFNDDISEIKAPLDITTNTLQGFDNTLSSEMKSLTLNSSDNSLNGRAASASNSLPVIADGKNESKKEKGKKNAKDSTPMKAESKDKKSSAANKKDDTQVKKKAPPKEVKEAPADIGDKAAKLGLYN